MRTVTPAQLEADLRGLAPAIRDAVHAATVRSGAMLQRQVVANASGRPGPEAPTGDYRRSISRLSTRLADSTTSRVGTNKPQARRLELGFSGTDELGRSYDQPAYPHFGPALDEVAPVFEQAVADAIAEVQS